MMKVDPPRPTTAIPELELQKLTDKQYHTIVEILGEAGRIQELRLDPDGGPNLRWRIEIAAAFLASALDTAREAAETNGDDPDMVMNLAADLTVRRAREIWGQGGA